MDWKYVIEEAYTENNNLNVYDQTTPIMIQKLKV